MIGHEKRPFAFCCAEGGGRVDACDCVNKVHGTAWFTLSASANDDVSWWLYKRDIDGYFFIAAARVPDMVGCGWTETPLYAHPPEPAASTVAQGDVVGLCNKCGYHGPVDHHGQHKRPNDGQPCYYMASRSFLSRATHHKGSSDGQ